MHLMTSEAFMAWSVRHAKDSLLSINRGCRPQWLPEQDYVNGAQRG